MCHLRKRMARNPSDRSGAVCHDGGVTGSLPQAGAPEPERPEGPDADSEEDVGLAGVVGGEWVEVYTPDGEAEQQAAPPRAFSGVVPTALFLCAAVLVLFASLLPLFRALEGAPPRGLSTIEVGAWRLSETDIAAGQTLATHVDPTPLPVGYPLAVAGLLVLLTIVLRLRGSRGARLLGVIAATFLAGLAFALGMFEVAWQNIFGDTGDAGVLTQVGEGFWVFVAAAAVAMLAAVLSFRTTTRDEPVRNTWPEQPDEPATEVPDGQPPEWPVVAVIPADERTNW